MKEWIAQLFDEYFSYVPHITVTDVVEIIIIAFVVYEIALWIKKHKGMDVVKGNACACRIHFRRCNISDEHDIVACEKFDRGFSDSDSRCISAGT